MAGSACSGSRRWRTVWRRWWSRWLSSRTSSRSFWPTRMATGRASRRWMACGLPASGAGRTTGSHREVMTSGARRSVDRHVLWLIKLWLKAPVEERDSEGTRRMSGGKGSTRGTPQGGVASPLLSVIYMNRFLKHWRLTGRGEAFRAHVITYADDFVILSRG